MRTTVHAALGLALVLLAACGEAPKTEPVGLGPEGLPSPLPSQPRPADLAEPGADRPAPGPGEAPAGAQTAQIVFEIEPLGRFEVVSWAEALRRAEGRITAGNAQDELRRLRQDLLGRRR
ncbi:MAG: hypothetical protein JNK02_03540 [Planctomycetes bacterium]|nr:hypothetical protein [Planctomycetota bacterium]